MYCVIVTSSLTKWSVLTEDGVEGGGSLLLYNSGFCLTPSDQLREELQLREEFSSAGN